MIYFETLKTMAAEDPLRRESVNITINTNNQIVKQCLNSNVDSGCSTWPYKGNSEDWWEIVLAASAVFIAWKCWPSVAGENGFHAVQRGKQLSAPLNARQSIGEHLLKWSVLTKKLQFVFGGALTIASIVLCNLEDLRCRLNEILKYRSTVTKQSRFWEMFYSWTYCCKSSADI